MGGHWPTKGARDVNHALQVQQLTTGERLMVL